MIMSLFRKLNPNAPLAVDTDLQKTLILDEVGEEEEGPGPLWEMVILVKS